MNKLKSVQLAGRLVIGRLPGLVLDDEHKQALKTGTLGGITLFKENCHDLEQLCSLTSAIFKDCLHPPVLTVDQEGGAVQRFEHVLSPLPSPMALAAINESVATRAITEISCRQLKTLGFNLLLAPTLDLLTNPLNPVIATRAFSSEIDLTASMGLQVIQAIEASGLIACPKHFPGHGSTSQDSHLELAIVDKFKSELEASDLAPFRENIKAMRAILVGHIWLPQIEAEQRPATLSPLVVNDILRKQLGFEGLAVSDDMTMHAITRDYGLGEACVMAVEAGIDLILVCGTFGQSQEAVQAIATAIDQGRLSEARIQESIERLDQLFSNRPVPLDPELAPERLEEFRRTIGQDSLESSKFSARSAALMRGDPALKQMGNLSPDQMLIVAPAHPRYSLPLAQELGAEEWRYPLNPKATDIEALPQKSDKTIVFVSFRSWINQGQIALAEALQPTVHVAADTPYDLAKMPESVKVSYATFDPSDQAIAGLAQIMTGRSAASGKVPVNLPE